MKNQKLHDKYAITSWPCYFFTLDAVHKYHAALAKHCEELDEGATDLSVAQKRRLRLYVFFYLNAYDFWLDIFYKISFLFSREDRESLRKAKIYDFLFNDKRNNRGKLISQIWDYDDWQLEHDHCYIQWLFPLDTPSDHNSEAPVISKSDIEQLNPHSLTIIQRNMIRSLSVMLRFYGFTLSGTNEFPVISKQNFDAKKENWCVMYNHNHLRITRILKSLRLFGLEQYAVAFYQALIGAEEEEKREHANELGWLVNPVTLKFWAEAVEK